VTLSAEMVERVRSQINEPASTTDSLRTDFEIAQWLQDGQLDYISKIPVDALPETIEEEAPVGDTWTRPDGFVKLLVILVNHAISSTVTQQEEATVLSVDESYLTLYYPGGLGTWAQFRKNVIAFGPNATGATIRYQKVPTNISDPCATFGLNVEHEEPIVNYATAKALAKINDADAERFMALYNDRVAAENNKYPKPYRAEKAPPRVEVSA
jgi:hypothetical protein